MQLGFGLSFGAGILAGMVVVGLISWWRMQGLKRQLQVAQQSADDAVQQSRLYQREQELLLAQKAELVAQMTVINTQRESLLQQNAKNEALLKEAGDMRQHLQETFENLSHNILKGRMAELEDNAQKNRAEELKSIDALVKPLKELIERNDKDTQSLKTQLDTFVRLNSQWVEAIRGSKGRGDWGELELYRLLEESGVEFEKQPTEQGLRPDVKVPLTNGRFLYIDAKTILTNLSRWHEADPHSGDATVAEERQKHVKALEAEIKKLSLKSYETLAQGSVDFVVLFVPRESMLRVALEESPHLMEDAFRQNVILASPLILMAVLKAVAYEWQQVRLSKDAESVKAIGQKLHNSAVLFIERFEKLGKQLVTVQRTYVEAQRSFSGQQGFIPQLRRFEDMGCGSKKRFPDPLIDLEEPVALLAGAEADSSN